MKKITSAALVLILVLMPVTQTFAINLTDYLAAMARHNAAPQVLGETMTTVLFKTTTTANVRATPSTAGVIVGKQPAGVIAAVVPGTATVSANGYMWVNLDFTTGADGWVAMNYIVEYKAAATTTSTADAYLQSIPAQIATLENILKNPDALKQSMASAAKVIATPLALQNKSALIQQVCFYNSINNTYYGYISGDGGLTWSVYNIGPQGYACPNATTVINLSMLAL